MSKISLILWKIKRIELKMSLIRKKTPFSDRFSTRNSVEHVNSFFSMFLPPPKVRITFDRMINPKVFLQSCNGVEDVFEQFVDFFTLNKSFCDFFCLFLYWVCNNFRRIVCKVCIEESERISWKTYSIAYKNEPTSNRFDCFILLTASRTDSFETNVQEKVSTFCFLASFWTFEAYLKRYCIWEELNVTLRTWKGFFWDWKQLLKRTTGGKLTKWTISVQATKHTRPFGRMKGPLGRQLDAGGEMGRIYMLRNTFLGSWAGQPSPLFVQFQHKTDHWTFVDVHWRPIFGDKRPTDVKWTSMDVSDVHCFSLYTTKFVPLGRQMDVQRTRGNRWHSRLEYICGTTTFVPGRHQLQLYMDVKWTSSAHFRPKKWRHVILRLYI